MMAMDMIRNNGKLAYEIRTRTAANALPAINANGLRTSDKVEYGKGQSECAEKHQEPTKATLRKDWFVIHHLISLRAS